MNFNETFEKAVERLNNHEWFILAFPIVTFVIAVFIGDILYYLTDIYFKIISHSEADEGLIALSLFFLLWAVCMALCASLLFGLGNRLLKYVTIHDRVNDLKSSGLVKKTKHSISLIGLSLHPFSTQDWMNILEEKLRDDVKVRLLIVDPETEFAQMRHSSFPSQKDKLCDDINDAIKKFSGFKEHISINLDVNVRNNFEVRKYKNNASMSTFIFDDEMRLGLMIEKGTGLTAPEIRISNHGKQSDLFKKIQDHFEIVWSDATEI
jgi:hypothetical protein